MRSTLILLALAVAPAFCQDFVKPYTPTDRPGDLLVFSPQVQVFPTTALPPRIVAAMRSSAVACPVPMPTASPQAKTEQMRNTVPQSAGGTNPKPIDGMPIIKLPAACSLAMQLTRPAPAPAPEPKQ